MSAPGLAEHVRLRLFRLVLSVLMAAIAMSEDAIAARLARRLGLDVPLIAHGVGIATLYGLNLVLTRRNRRERRHPVLAGYAAVAFTALFGGVFLATAELVWTLVAFAAPPAARLAGILPTVDAGAWRPAFDAGIDLGLAAIAALFVFGYTAGRRALAVDARRVRIAGLPPGLAGFRIVHVSDLHVGRYLRPEELVAHVARINALAPDLVCITGDLVDRAGTCAEAFPRLAGLQARHGVVVTLGNHDFGAGADAVTAALRRLTPFTVLRNARLDVAHDGARLAVIGVDDLAHDWARGVREHPALPRLARAVPSGTPLVVLTHRPDCFPQAAALGADLVLAGHTHGGQIGLPSWSGRRVWNPAQLITRYDRGVFTAGTATLVISNGLGFTGQPVRLFTPRQIGCLELQPA